MSTNSHSVRVVVRLPYNRPHDGYDNPVPVRIATYTHDDT